MTACLDEVMKDAAAPAMSVGVEVASAEKSGVGRCNAGILHTADCVI